MKIHFVTGKGGVGKSAVAAAMAVGLARQGHKTLLVELGDQSFYEKYLDIPKVSFKAANVRENFDVALWSGADCLREYALHLLKVQSLYRLFFENPVSKALIQVAPALPELAIVGKVTSGPPRNVGPRLNYDSLVIDAFASGHFVALIRAAQGMAEAIRLGPMGEQCRSIDKVLRDPQLCSYHVVSLPEELPVIEALELADSIEKILGQKAQHILNRVLPNLETFGNFGVPVPPTFENFSQHIHQVFDKQDQFLKRLQGASSSVRVLPWVFAHQSWQVVEGLTL